MDKGERREEYDNSIYIYEHLDKTTLYEETKYFYSARVNPVRCTQILSKVLYLFNQDETWTAQQTKVIFFGITKLFQSKDVFLRRIVYLCIKELSSRAQNVIIATPLLTKDMTGKEDQYRAAALRTLCTTTDSSMMQLIEKYMKQAIVDKNPVMSSAALVSALHLSAKLPELCHRLIPATRKAMMSDNIMVSYHALGFVAAVKSNDRLSTAQLVLKMSRSQLHSPYTTCQLIRHAAKLAEEDQHDSSELYLQFIESCLRHKSEIVVYEAAHAIVLLRKSAKDLSPAISVLQTFCGSSKATLRLAGVRTLATLTNKHPSALAACTADLEKLISDPNRSVATLAVTTLLATGAVSSIDRLLKQILSFISEITDEFKIVVVDAVKRLCSKYPQKYKSLASFLAGMLRGEGGLQYKTAVVDAMITLVEENPDAKETGLTYLGEFIEFCEHSDLKIRILHVLGRECPKDRRTSNCIGFIYNRVILESGPVRVAAITAVARFGALRPELRPNIKVLLDCCKAYEEDEARDRAVYYSAILDSGDTQLINDYIVNILTPDPILLKKLLDEHLQSKHADEPTTPQEKEEVHVEIEPNKVPTASLNKYPEHLKLVPGIEILGPFIKSCKPINLTQRGTEYRVKCVKHIFANHIIFQFKCLNTRREHYLENVRVRLETPPGYVDLDQVICRELPYNKPGNIFCVLHFPITPTESLGRFDATLEFFIRECDRVTWLPNTFLGYTDIYTLENFEVYGVDQFKINAPNDEWETIWEEASHMVEILETFSLRHADVDVVATNICEQLELSPSTILGDYIKEIRGVGTWRQNTPVLFRAKMTAAMRSVTLQLTARSPRKDIATFLVAVVG